MQKVGTCGLKILVQIKGCVKTIELDDITGTSHRGPMINKRVVFGKFAE